MPHDATPSAPAAAGVQVADDELSDEDRAFLRRLDEERTALVVRRLCMNSTVFVTRPHQAPVEGAVDEEVEVGAE